MPLSHAEIESIKHRVHVYKLRKDVEIERLPWYVRFWRWLTHYVDRDDYCGRCDKVVRWQLILHKVEYDHPPLFGTYVCTECGLALSHSPFDGWDKMGFIGEREDMEEIFADWVNE